MIWVWGAETVCAHWEERKHRKHRKNEWGVKLAGEAGLSDGRTAGLLLICRIIMNNMSRHTSRHFPRYEDVDKQEAACAELVFGAL